MKTPQLKGPRGYGLKKPIEKIHFLCNASQDWPFHNSGSCRTCKKLFKEDEECLCIRAKGRWWKCPAHPMKNRIQRKATGK